jgi:hypothetical protein
MNFLRLSIRLIIMMAFINICSARGFAQKPNFSGAWKRNTEKCDPGTLSINSIPVSLDVVQIKNKIDIKRTSKNRLDSTFIYTETLGFDGSKAISVPKVGIKKTSSIQWTTDPNGFIDTADYTDDQGNLVQTIKETWTLEDGGNTLKILSLLFADGQTYHLTQIFEK